MGIALDFGKFSGFFGVNAGLRRPSGQVKFREKIPLDNFIPIALIFCSLTD
jgi:hypothetical protein